MTNPVSGGFQLTPAQGLMDTVAYKTVPDDETHARQQIMDMIWQIMNEMNMPTTSAAAFAQYNKLINGNFDITSTGTSFTNPANNTLTLDRYKVLDSPDGGTNPTLTHSQKTLTPGDLPNSEYYYNINANGAGVGFGANSQGAIEQRIENGTRYLAGLGEKITVSFNAKSSIPGKKVGVFMSQIYGTGGSPSAAENINGTNWTLTSNWTRYTFTFTLNALAGKTFGTNGDDFLIARIYTMWGANIESKVGASTTETYVGSGDVSIAQFQVNTGDVALPFQPKTSDQESLDCMRFNIRFIGTNTTAILGTGQCISTTQANIFIPFPKKMRALPAFLTAGNLKLSTAAGGVQPVTALTLDSTSSRLDGVMLVATVASGLVAGNTTVLSANNDATAYLNFNAEL